MIGRIVELLNNYVLARISGRPSCAAFWYSPDYPNITDSKSLAAYKTETPSPFYPICYRSRTTFPVRNDEGIVMLPYPEPIGVQINPEAAFQTALGYHDCWVSRQDDEAKKTFLTYASFFKERQSDEGKWYYQFDWYENKAPWASALAQARGASVMLRAFLLTGEQEYRHAALSAISSFDVPSSKGGFLSVFEPTGSVYFEEYPSQENVTLNGFLATLFGLWELSYWLESEQASRLLKIGVKSAEAMLPYYSIGWWTLYDTLKPAGRPNVHSPRYHKMCVGYLAALSAMTGSQVLIEQAQRWKRMDTLFNRLRAYWLKTKIKLLVGAPCDDVAAAAVGLVLEAAVLDHPALRGKFPGTGVHPMPGRGSVEQRDEAVLRLGILFICTD